MFLNSTKRFLKINLNQLQVRFINKKEFNDIQESYLNESCIKVNNYDEPLGMITKKDCHTSRKYFKK